jgi:hypothetical protein
VELEGKKRPLADAAPLARRAAHHYQHRLELRPATLLTAPGLLSQTLCGFGEGRRPPASKLLSVLQPDLELYPDGQRVRSKRFVVKRGGRVAVDGICERGAE